MKRSLVHHTQWTTTIILVCCCCQIGPKPRFVADAAFSTLALDQVHRQIGAAGATCLQDPQADSLASLYRSVPGKGVWITQGLLMAEDEKPVIVGRELLANSTAPEEIIDQITNSSVDTTIVDLADGERLINGYRLRQYAIVDFEGRSATHYSPIELESLYERLGYPHTRPFLIQGSLDDGESSLVYSVQGDIVASSTVTTMESEFRRGGGCDLAERLFLAVTAVSDQEGDLRCADTAASIAFLRVEDEEGNVVVSINVKYPSDVSTQPFDPFVGLRSEYLAFRKENHCDDSVVATTLSPASAPRVASSCQKTRGISTAMALFGLQILILSFVL